MAISGVNPKCYILALFVRDDGARFLLGDDPFEFKDNQLHFQQNTMANDVVEVQGNDGYLLAGQVRRPGTQMFDGYVCNGTNSKEEVEVKRRAFLQFFRRSHFYKVIYVFPNGTAIQRKQGFLVDDPTVQELYQQYPAYHVALNFEDVNYYTYEEDDQGHEIYAKEAIVPLARGGATGGLIWDSYGVVWEDPWSLPLNISGVQFQILNNAGARAPIDNIELYGAIYQQTYSGYNLINLVPMTNTQPTKDQQCTFETVMDATLGKNVLHITGTSIYPSVSYRLPQRLESGKYYVLKFTYRSMVSGSPQSETMWFAPNWSNSNYWNVLSSIKSGRAKPGDEDTENSVGQSTTWKTTSRRFYVVPSQHSSASSSYAYICFSLGYNANSTKELWLADAELYEITEDEWNADTYTSKDYEPYTGGIPAPNPDYPQPIQVVTGEQTVTVTGKNLLDLTGATLPTKATGEITNGRIYIQSWTSGSVEILQPLNLEPGTYTISYHFTAPNGYDTYWNLRASDGTTNISPIGPNGATTNAVDNDFTRTVTINAPCAYIRFAFSSASRTPLTITNLMIEKSDSATSYQPYQGSTYTIDLGATELCKINDYQDYIYKSGDDWYVHKETGTQVLNGTEAGWASGTSSGYLRCNVVISDISDVGGSSVADSLSNYFTASTTAGYGVFFHNGTRLFFYPQSSITTLAAFKTWLGSNNATTYYPLATPTDTKITDATLVGQLEALGAMKLFIGENNVLVSAPTPNLPATLSFDYYTKFAAIGAEWEEGGTKGATIVNVDAIDNTYPVWELTGPATNPTLSVLTTNTTLTYNGTITASQKLVIDMFNKTATLNGTSVIGNISGDFVYMAPGTNRLAYTAGNTDAPDSTIYWQEVVG